MKSVIKLQSRINGLDLNVIIFFSSDGNNFVTKYILQSVAEFVFVGSVCNNSSVSRSSVVRYAHIRSNIIDRIRNDSEGYLRIDTITNEITKLCSGT